MKRTDADRRSVGIVIRLLSMVLTLAILIPAFPLDVLAATVAGTEGGQLVVTDADGKQSIVDDSWETRFPYGTFAFGEVQLELTEGEANTVTLTLHRLGGTVGRAEADIVLMPGVTTLDDGLLSYVNAVGRADYSVEVELPQPIAYFQPLGGVEKAHVPSELQVEFDYNLTTNDTLDWSTFPPTTVEYGSQYLFVPAPGSTVQIGVPARPLQADSYRWQLRDISRENSEWEDIGDAASEAYLPISNEIFFSGVMYDYRLIYTIDGVTYCSVSFEGEVYTPPVSDVDPVPEGFVNELAPGLAGVELTGGEYDAQGFTVIFAEGEEKKEIVFSVEDDTLAEADEFLLINILQARGAELYDSANTISLRVIDNEPMEPSFVGFASATAIADKAAGSVRLTLVRSGGLQYPVTVPFTYQDGTARVGTDYAGFAGTAYFAPGAAETYIDLELIQAGEKLPPERALTMSIHLNEVQGGGENSGLVAGAESMLLLLYNTGDYVDDPNLATVLHGEGVDDVSRDVKVASGSIVGGTTSNITGTPVEQPTEYLAGVIHSGPQSRSYDFGGNAVSFTREIEGYESNYWVDDESLLDIYPLNLKASFTKNDDEAQVDPSDTSGATEGIYGTKTITKDGYGVVLEHNSNANVNPLLTIEDGGTLFSGLKMRTWIRNIGWDQYDEGDELVVMPRFYVSTGTKNILEHEWNGGSFQSYYDESEKNWMFNRSHFYDPSNPQNRRYSTYGYADGEEIPFGQTLTASIWLSRWSLEALSGGWHDNYNGNNHAYYTTAAYLEELIGTRRYFTQPLKMLIHTANDADVLGGMTGTAAAAASRISDYALLEPSIELVPNKGGITEGGQLYVGSTLRVGVKSSAAFDPISNENGYAVYLTNSQGKIVARAGNPITDTASGKLYYELKLMWDGMNAASLTDTYTVNVVMQRTQTITISYAPSMNNATGNRGDDAAINDFRNTANGKAKKGMAEHVVANLGKENYPAYFAYRESQIATNDWSANKTTHTLSFDSTNTYFVNFGQEKDDKILYNGQIYDGDANIYLSAADLQNAVVSFVWYDKDYLTATSDMQPTIVRMERYLDLDGDGQVAGSYNAQTGIFTPANDYPLGAFMLDSTYEITQLQPMRHPEQPDNPDFYRQVVKVYYTKVPRSLNAQAGKENHKGQMVPYLLTGITSESLRQTLTKPELAIRYLRTTETVEIYGAAAQAMQMVDVPFGGDIKPPKLKSDEKGNQSWVWESRDGIGGYLLEDFKSLSPIRIRMSFLGEDYPVVSEGVTLKLDGSWTITPEASAVLNNYLGSLNSEDTFGIAIREIDANNNPLHYEATAASGLRTFPDSSVVASLTGGGQNGMSDSENSGNPVGEFNIDTGVELPTFNFGLTDYVTIIMDGYEVGFQIGVPLVGTSTKFHKDSSTGKRKWDDETNPKTANADELEELKEMFSGDETPRQLYRDLKQKQNEARTAAGSGAPPKLLTSKAFDVDVCFNFTIIFKYNPLDNGYYFSQASFMLSGAMDFTITARLTVCPIVYAYFHVGLEVNVGMSINADRVKDLAESVNLTPYTPNLATGLPAASLYDAKIPANAAPYIGEQAVDYYLYTKKTTLGPNSSATAEENDFLRLSTGTTFSYTSRYKALDIVFDGRLLISADVPGFVGGTITSDGSEPVLIKLQSDINGQFDRAYTVTFRVLPDEESGEPIYTYVDTITPVERVATNVSFGGIEINPTVFVEIGAGVGVEVLKVEIFARVSLSFALAIAPGASGDTKGDVEHEFIRFTYFELAASLGIRAVVLFFDFEFEGLRLSVSYDWADRIKQDEGWRFTVYLGGQKIHSSSLRSLDLSDAKELTVTVRPPVDLSSVQKLYTPADNTVNPYIRALNPTDPRVPFQLSSFGSSADAFALGEQLQSGGDFRLAAFGGETYMAYIINRAGAVNSIDATQLVLSRVANTGANGEYGMVHPLDPTAPLPYLVIDDNAGGDLNFNVRAEDDGLRFVWTTYAAPAPASADDAQAQAATAARQTVVKTAALTAQGLTAPVTLTTAGSHRFVPQSAGDLIFFGETIHFTDVEQAERDARYDAVYTEVQTQTANVGGQQVVYTQDDPSGYYMKTQSQLMDSIYGKTTSLNFALPQADGSYAVYCYAADDWAEKGVRIESAELTQADENTYYLAYVTTIEDLISADEANVAYRESGDSIFPVSTLGQTRTIRQLYLQKITVAPDGSLSVGQAALLRSLVDYRDNSLLSSAEHPLDGLYANSTQIEAYQDPYLTNLRFLYGRLGTLQGTEENFNQAVEFYPMQRSLIGQPPEENFLLFEMNGETYIIPEASLAGITGENVLARTGYIIPFFGSGQGLAEGVGTTIGVDGNGTVTAVYTKAVTGSPNNALYMTKYDAQSGTWGVGTMLAMHNLDVYERAAADLWTMEETEARYYDPQYGGSMDNFTFRELDIALGGEDELVIVTRGTLTEMVESIMYKSAYASNPDTGEYFITGVEARTAQDANNTVIEPKRDAAGNLVSNTGIYVVSYGVGQQTLASPVISFRDWNLAPGATLVPTLSFINGGDVAIRAGSPNPDGTSSNPISVKLLLGTLSPDRRTVTQTETLAEWEIHETIRAGASVSLYDASFTMPADCAGKVIYFLVEEDTRYFQSAASLTSLAYDAFGQITAGGASILVEAKPELYFQKLETAVIDASNQTDAAQTATIRLSAIAANMGTANAQPVYLRVQSVTTAPDGTEVTRPIDLTGHNLDISEELQFRTRDITGYIPSNGYLLLARENESAETAGRLGEGMAREITGTFTVPKAIFTGDDNTATLRFSLVNADTTQQEFIYTNNENEKRLSPRTFFTAPVQLALTLGSTLRLPLDIRSSGSKTPIITVVELPEEDDQGFVEGKLGVLYYDAASDALVLSGAKEGSGAIQISDVTTNSGLTVYYTISGVGADINIYNDNQIFSWNDSTKWSYTLVPGPLDGVAVLRNDISVGQADATVTFESYADALKLFFKGKVTVTSSLGGSWTLTSDNIGEGKTVTFPQTTSQRHTVTIHVDQDATILDKYGETILNPNAAITTADMLAPELLWGRSFPAPASIRAGESVTLPLYLVDDSGLASVTAMLDGQAVALQPSGQPGDKVWRVDVPFNANGTFTLSATDAGGRTQSTTVNVTWFNAAKDFVTTDRPISMTAALTGADGQPIIGTLAIDKFPYVQWSTVGMAGDADLSRFHVTTKTDTAAQTETPIAQSFIHQMTLAAQPGGTTLSPLIGGVGIYLLEVKQDDGSFVRTVVEFPRELYPADSPTGTLTLMTDEEGNRFLVVTVNNPYSSGYSLYLNNVELTPVGGKSMVTQQVEVQLPDTYELKLDGSTHLASITVENPPISASVVSVTDIVGSGSGAVTLQVSGGYLSRYEYAIRPQDSQAFSSYIPADSSEITISGLAAGTYEIIVRDRQVPSNTSAVLTASIEQLTLIVNQPENGTITVTHAEPLVKGTPVTVTVTPAQSYFIDTLSMTDRVGNPVPYTMIVEGVYSFAMPASTVTISATMTQEKTYKVEILTLPENGILTVDRATARKGETVTITASANAHFALDALEVRAVGVPVALTPIGADQYSFIMPESDVIIGVNISAIPFYQIHLPTQSIGGTLTASATAAHAGETVDLTVLPLPGYYPAIPSVVDRVGAPVQLTPNPDGSYRFLMPPRDVYTAISFTPIPYTVHLPAQVAGGTLTVTPNPAYHGDIITITAIANRDYQLELLEVLDAVGQPLPLTENPDGSFSFIMPLGDVTVNVHFEKELDLWLAVLAMRYARTYSITASANEGGTITPVGVTEVSYSRNQQYSITAEEGYVLEAVLVDGVDVGVVETYTFTDVDAPHTIHAVFRELPKPDPLDSFAGDETVTRAELAVLLWQLEGSPDAETNAEFFDIAPDAEYAAAIRWVSANDIILGRGNGLFGPDDPISREQMTMILRRYAVSLGWVTAEPTDKTLPFTCSAGAEQDVLWAYRTGLLDGLTGDMTIAVTRTELADCLRLFRIVFPGE